MSTKTLQIVFNYHFCNTINIGEVSTYMSINSLVQKYEKDKEYYLSEKYNETQLRSDFLDVFFELLGWDIKNKSQKPTFEREVILEESLKQGFLHAKKPDYTFRLFNERKFFLEAKKPSVDINKDALPAKQTRRYGFTAKLKISVLSNFEYLMIYDCSQEINEADTVNKALIKKYHYSQYVECFNEIQSIIGKDTVYDGNFDKKWSKIDENLEKFSVDTLFLAQINEWRLLLGTEIFKLFPDVTESELNDYVQSYINSLIFLRVCEDRNIEEYNCLLNIKNKDNFNLLLEKFELADKKYNSGLFKLPYKEKIIKNSKSIFWEIIKKLYYPESTYSFSVFSSDILGNIYEIFLQDKLYITNSSIKLDKKPENIDRDIVTTPLFIIQNILEKTIIDFCCNKLPSEILKSKFADISCGSGAFLLEAFQLLNDIFIDYYIKNDKTKLIHIGINSYKLSFNLKKEILLNCIFGIDKDFNAVESAKFGLLLKLLENETIETLPQSIPLLPDLSENISCGNSLISSEDIKNYSNGNKFTVNPFNFNNIKFDIIIGNPPYMKTEDIKSLTPLEKPIYENKYISAYKQYDKYFLFLEQSIALLKDNGMLGYILPSKFTKVEAATALRKLLKEKSLVNTLISFGSNQIFSGKTTYTNILILSKSHNEEINYIEVNNLAEWKIKKYNSNASTNQINVEKLDDNGWVLLTSNLENIHAKILKQSVTLEKFIGKKNIFNGIQTSRNDMYVFKPIDEDDTNYYFCSNGKNWEIEKELTRPYYETPDTQSDDSLNTYKVFRPNRFVIYPYQKKKNKIEFVKIEDLKITYPNAYKYFIENKGSFVNSKRGGKRDIKPIPLTADEWYRYGRQQSLDIGEIKEKIVVGVLSQGNKYAIDHSKTLLSSGGTAGYCMITLPENSNYSIYYLQAILNSKYVEWNAALYGEVFRGGYIARGTKVLSKLPIRKINFEDKIEKNLYQIIDSTQRQLIQTHELIDENTNNKRQKNYYEKEFNILKEKLDNALMSLYGLTKEEDVIIPNIKEIYETSRV